MMHRKAISRTARPGFTLMELMVSVAILLAVLAMIGTIFTTTSKAGGNATAITTVYRQLRQAAEMMRQDLERMDPSNDALGIAGVQVRARTNRKYPDYIEWQRADVLMLLTDRRDTRTYAYRDFVDPATEFGESMQVVYGHADTARFDVNGLPIANTIKRIEGNPSALPSYEWHLARRTVLFPSMTMASGLAGVYNGPLSSPAFLVGQADLTRVPLASVYPSFRPGMFHFINGNGTLADFYLENWVGFPDVCSYLRTLTKPEWRLYRSSQGRWYQWEGPSEWRRDDVRLGGPDIIVAADPPAVIDFANNNGLDKHFYDATASDRRTVIDASPLQGQSVRIGPQFLPNCSELRVEYTYDDPRDVNPNHNFGTGPGDPVTAGGATTFARPVHWNVVGHGEQIVWSKISAYPSDRTFPVRWPTALRITLKAWDSGGRLDQPVTYSIVHCWPSGN